MSVGTALADKLDLYDQTRPMNDWYEVKTIHNGLETSKTISVGICERCAEDPIYLAVNVETYRCEDCGLFCCDMCTMTNDREVFRCGPCHKSM